MHVRIGRSTVPLENIERAIATFPDRIGPTIRKHPGNVGVAALLDRPTGKVVVVTYWDSEQSLKASEQLVQETRSKAAAELGLKLGDIDTYEVTLQERAQAPKSGTFVRINTGQGSPDQIDAATRELRQGLSEVLTLKGFRALIAGVNKSNGKFIISSVWDTVADREASEKAVASLRQRVTDTAKSAPIQIEKYEAVYVDIPVRAGVS